MQSQKTFLLSAIIPVKGIVRARPFLLETLQKCDYLPIQVILSFDEADVSNYYLEFQQELNLKFMNPPLVFISEYNSPGLARNRALLEAKAEWITFWDSDDIPDPAAVISLIYETVLKEQEIGVGKFTTATSKNPQHVISSQEDWSHNPFIDVALNPGIWRFVFKSERIKGIQFPKMLMGEDQIFLAKLNIDHNEVNFSKTVTYKYLKHSSGQLTKTKSSINEIYASSKLLNLEFTSNRDSMLNLLFLTNQILTGLLRTDFKTKVKYINLIITLFRKYPDKFRIIRRSLPKLVSRKIKSNG